MKGVGVQIVLSIIIVVMIIAAIVMFLPSIRENIVASSCKSEISSWLDKAIYRSCEMNDMDDEYIETIDLSCLKEMDYKLVDSKPILEVHFKNSARIYKHNLFCPQGYVGAVSFDFSAYGDKSKLKIEGKDYSFVISKKNIYLCEGDEDSCKCCFDCSCKSEQSCNLCSKLGKNTCYYDSYSGTCYSKETIPCNDKGPSTTCDNYADYICKLEGKQAVSSGCIDNKCQFLCGECENIKSASDFPNYSFCIKSKCESVSYESYDCCIFISSCGDYKTEVQCTANRCLEKIGGCYWSVDNKCVS